jgi:hypothetical protein
MYRLDLIFNTVVKHIFIFKQPFVFKPIFSLLFDLFALSFLKLFAFPCQLFQFIPVSMIIQASFFIFLIVFSCVEVYSFFIFVFDANTI